MAPRSFIWPSTPTIQLSCTSCSNTIHTLTLGPVYQLVSLTFMSRACLRDHSSQWLAASFWPFLPQLLRLAVAKWVSRACLATCLLCLASLYGWWYLLLAVLPLAGCLLACSACGRVYVRREVLGSWAWSALVTFARGARAVRACGELRVVCGVASGHARLRVEALRFWIGPCFERCTCLAGRAAYFGHGQQGSALPDHVADGKCFGNFPRQGPVQIRLVPRAEPERSSENSLGDPRRAPS